jgi:hypothetical protein
MDANGAIIPLDTNAPAVEPQNTERRDALLHNLAATKNNAITPYIPDQWLKALVDTGLIHRYPSIPKGLIFGFDIGIPQISHIFSPLNHPSVANNPLL